MSFVYDDEDVSVVDFADEPEVLLQLPLGIASLNLRSTTVKFRLNSKLI
jgi:hypothetical protein